MKHWFRTLRFRNYRLFFMGQGISLIGTWMQRIALSWLVYRLTHSAFLLGLVSFSGQLPTLIVTPFSGVFVDRHNKYRIIVVAQILAMIQAFVLAFLVITGTIHIYQLVILGFLLGLVNSFEIPARQSFVIEMIEEKEELSNAIALNSSLVNLARLLGPSLAGMIIAVAGEGVCFFINGVSYFAVLLSLLSMKIIQKPRKKRDTHVLHDLKEGFVYVFQNKPIRSILMVLAIGSLASTSYQTLLPVFAKDIFKGGSHLVGFMSAASGGGSLMGALYLASRKSKKELGTLIGVASFLLAISLIVFSLSTIFWVSMLLLVLMGMGMMLQMAASNTMVQTLVDDNKRGRVMSIYVMAWMGMTPFGALLAGVLAQYFGSQLTVLICGVCCLLASLMMFGQLKRPQTPTP